MKYQTKADSLLKFMFQRLAPIAAMVCCVLFYCPAQSPTTKYRIVWCDTIGHILGVSFKNNYPKKGTKLFLNTTKWRIINTVHSNYNNKDGRKEIDIYLVPVK